MKIKMKKPMFETAMAVLDLLMCLMYLFLSGKYFYFGKWINGVMFLLCSFAWCAYFIIMLKIRHNKKKYETD